MITFDYAGDDSQVITFDSSMSWMITTYSALAVSDTYLYVRNVEDNLVNDK